MELHIEAVGPHIDEEAGLLCSDVEVEALGQPYPCLLLGSPENLSSGYYHVHFHLRCHWNDIHGEVPLVGHVEEEEWPSGPLEGCVSLKVQKKTLWRTNYY